MRDSSALCSTLLGMGSKGIAEYVFGLKRLGSNIWTSPKASHRLCLWQPLCLLCSHPSKRSGAKVQAWLQ